MKEAKGNPGHRPIGEDPPIEFNLEAPRPIETPAAPAELAPARPAGVAPPIWLKKEGLKIWERLTPRMMAMKLLGQVDAEAFGRYCRNFARWLKMQKILDTEGETYESDSLHGKLKRAHPAYLIADRLERQLAAAEANFGLNPAERQRLYAARAAGQAWDNDLFGNHKPPAPPAKDQPKPLAETPAMAKPRSAIGLLN